MLDIIGWAFTLLALIGAVFTLWAIGEVGLIILQSWRQWKAKSNHITEEDRHVV